MSKVTAGQQQAWSVLVSKTYAEQAVWFLNGFWTEGLELEAENVWKWVELFGQLDQEKRATGSELDEFWSHKFLESLGETLTVLELRERLRTIDVDNNRRMSLIEYLIFRYKKSITAVLNASQGENKEELAEAQEKVNSAQAAVEEVVRRLEEQRTAAAAAKRDADAAAETAGAAAAAEAEATRTADAAKAAADEAKAAADAADAVAAPYRAAVAENDAALKELQAQESAYAKKKTDLEAVKADASIGVVKRNKAANELDQLLAEDPLPLRKAKIGQAATLRKMEKAAAPFNEASAKANAAAEASAAAAAEAEAAAENARAERAKADEAAAEAARSAEAAEEAARQVAQAVAEAESQLAEAVSYLEAVKKKGGVAHGAIWWMERQITEKKKFMPKRKQ